jgi:hypothetical protein
MYLHRRLAAALASLGLALMTASCGGGDSKVALPSKTTVGPILPATTVSTEQEAVKTAYTAFWDVSDRALTAPAEQVRSILRDYAAGAYLDLQVRQIVLLQTEHKGPWGKVVLHIGAVKVSGSQASVRDCQDASNAGLADTRTSKLIPGTRGPKKRNLAAQLTKGSDGRWRLSDLKQFRGTC